MSTFDESLIHFDQVKSDERQEILLGTKKLTVEYFNELVVNENNDLNDLYQMLVKYIHYQLDKNFEGLLNLIYRIDLKEKEFVSALESEKPAHNLSLLILKRIVQKVILRKRYA
ncbi:hypothetical protein [Aureibacter tunicatorum]|uniref:Uncharacterized protein n=1 Tax=Aureibacter tunicatorum TaxID=866807 RepID=A0AAE4BUP4_9BACT|nr:hypothetical protein [Aureibacter tunicatorum]MDR6241285.1 hypothetical protein [Aureibacter tunicatorum]BDD03545.1 hypothetical protein AUTU_10280 [Aureibacter tunicatorum]